MPRPKYAALTGALVRRGITTRRVQIIGPDGEFQWADMPYEADLPVQRCCGTCGQPVGT